MPASSTTPKKSAAKLSVVAASKAVAPKPKKAAAKTPVAAKTSVRSRKAKGDGAAVSDQQRRNYVEVAAYYIAQRRGFHGGSELDDWVQAEIEVDRLLSEGFFTPA